jgi:hypothetical protein
MISCDLVTLYGFIVKNSAAQEVRVSTSERRE